MMWNGVKVTAQVSIYDFAIASIQQPMHFIDCVVRAALRAVRILFFGQIRLKDRFQHDDCCHLCHSIFDRRYTQRSFLTVWFGDQHPPDRLRSVGLFL
jgi:hypothetical protein